MAISPLKPLQIAEIKNILAIGQLDDISLRHICWHALQIDSAGWEVDELAFCLNENSVSRGTNGEYQKQIGLVVMDMLNGISLGAKLHTPIAQTIIQQHQCKTALQNIFKKDRMKILQLSELRHPVFSGFYSPDEYEQFLKKSAPQVQEFEVMKI